MEVIHKINITAEAKFDIVEILGLQEFDWQTFKKTTEKHIADCIPWLDYFRADYIDKDSGKMLKFFFYRVELFGIMQIWNLAGVCEIAHYNEDSEENGQIRAWINTEIYSEMPKITEEWLIKNDWVIWLRVNNILEEATRRDLHNHIVDNTARPSYWTDIIQEVQNAFECERDKKAAWEVALLQSRNYYFRRRERNGKKLTR